jgi:hypothetical protein
LLTWPVTLEVAGLSLVAPAREPAGWIASPLFRKPETADVTLRIG